MSTTATLGNNRVGDDHLLDETSPSSVSSRNGSSSSNNHRPQHHQQQQHAQPDTTETTKQEQGTMTDAVATSSSSTSSNSIVPEATRPPPSSSASRMSQQQEHRPANPSAWGNRVPSSPTTRSSSATTTKTKAVTNNLRAIMLEEEAAIQKEKEERAVAAAVQAQQQQDEATQIAAMEQEEEMIRLALERSLTDLGGSFVNHNNHNHTISHSPNISTRSINSDAVSSKSGSVGGGGGGGAAAAAASHSSSTTASSDPLAWKVQAETEATELHIESPHGVRSPMLNRRILIKTKPTTTGTNTSISSGIGNSMRSLGASSSASSCRSLTNTTTNAHTTTTTTTASQINHKALTTATTATAAPAAATSTNSTASACSAAVGVDRHADGINLEEARKHLSPEEVEQIEHALGISSGNDHAAAPAVAAEDSKPSAAATTTPLSLAESQAIEKALREADEEEERNSLRLAMQILEEDKQELADAAAAAAATNNKSKPQGNVRTMTRAELEAEQNYDYYNTNSSGADGSGAYQRHSARQDYHVALEHDHYDDDDEEDLAAGFRMNSSSRQEWNRLDQHSVVGPNNEVRTKHDASLHGQANAQRLGLERGDGATIVGNKAYNSFMKSVRRQKTKGVATYGTGRAGSDADATKGGAMDPTVRIEISRAINNGLIEKCNGVVKEGKEAVVYHADKGLESEDFDVAVKVFKRIQEFKGRGDYVVGDPRYAKVSFKNAGPREQLSLWAEKEFRNLIRANRVGVPVPTPLLSKENILFMRFLGVDGWPAPQLRELELRRGSKRWTTLYNQTMSAIRTLYQRARLVHADLSEYNIMVVPSFLVQNKAIGVEDDDDLQIALIDFGQAVDVRHPEASGLLERDVERVQFFFKRTGVDVMGEKESLEFVTKPEELPPPTEESSD